MKYYLKYFGCLMNQVDAEKLATIFNSVGFKRTEEIEKADIITILSCSVRQSAVDRAYGIFHQRKLKKGVIKILTGCILDNDFKKLQDRFDIIIDITKIKQLPCLIKSYQPYYQYGPKNNRYLEIASNSENKWEKLIPISNGCNQFCTYCAVPYTRGQEVNRSAQKILKEVKKISNDVRKITLLGQTVNSYLNPDKNSSLVDFADLLEQVAILKPQTWISFLSPYPTKFNLKLIKIIAKYNNISKHIHLPLQSGSDRILKLMNRKYTSLQFYKIVNQIYKYIPDANLTTDVIVGFPGENKSDFQKTIQVVKKCRFTAIFTGLYSPRPGTVADKIYEDKITQKEKRIRDEKITKIVAKISAQKNKKLIGNRYQVLVQNIKGNIAITKTKNNETIRVKHVSKKDLGKFINIQITKALDWSMEAKKVKDKLVVVLGPTACGKTKIGVALAQKFNGEIISADSRQVYQGMDIGTGKDLQDYHGVAYHLIDIAKPQEQVTLKHWQELAFQKIRELNNRAKLPLLVGGTGLYLNSIIDGYILKDQEVNQKLRKYLNKLSLKTLQNKLRKIDQKAFQKIDLNNARRIIRAIEMAKNNSSLTEVQQKKPDLDILVLGIKFDRNEIYQRIDNRLKYRLEKEALISEVQQLHHQGVSWKRLDDFGLEYRWIAKYLRKEIDKNELFIKLSQAIHHFAKRQLTWFKKRKDVVWIKNVKEAKEIVKKFLE